MSSIFPTVTTAADDDDGQAFFSMTDHVRFASTWEKLFK